MVEAYMYAGGGVLGALLVALLLMPLVHQRAVRLTARRLEAATPVLSEQMRADKDQLRAEFAMTTRRLEMSVENMKTKASIQLAELQKKDEEVAKLRQDLSEKIAAAFSLESRDRAFREQVRVAEEEISIKTTELHACKRELAEKIVALEKLTADYADCSKTSEERKVEIMMLKTHVEAIKARDAILLSVMISPSKWQPGDSTTIAPADTLAQPIVPVI